MISGEHLKLIERIQAGDSGAGTELFRRYMMPILWKIARCIQTSEENVKDVACEVYMGVLEGLRKEDFRPERWENLDVFIWGVTQNKIRDWFKQQKRQKKHFVTDPPVEQIAEAAESYFLEKKELEKLLRGAIRKLDTKYQEVLELRYLQELSIQEISQKTGLPPRRVSERVHYALKLMRNACQKSNIFSIFLMMTLLFTRNI
jgi:RNA polymerase sigma-70 factor (ECF subfamily)